MWPDQRVEFPVYQDARGRHRSPDALLCAVLLWL